MTLRAALRFLTALLLVALATFVCTREFTALRTIDASSRSVVVSDFARGLLVERRVIAKSALDASLGERVPEGVIRVFDETVSSGVLIRRPKSVFEFALLPGVDGIEAHLDGRSETFTPDDLRALSLYDKAKSWAALGTIGFDTVGFYAVVAERMHADVRDVMRDVTLRRVRFQRIARVPDGSKVTSEPTPENLREGSILAARYLARNLRDDGMFHYIVRPADGHTGLSNSVPRHAGAAWFLAEIAAETRAPSFVDAARKAADAIRSQLTARCGSESCVAERHVADLGSNALTLLAYTRLVASGLDESFRPELESIVRFIHGMVRSDGEFDHYFDLELGRNSDLHRPFYTSEAALALARAYEVTHDRRDIELAKAALTSITGGSWSFYGSKHYFAEEHWTCQALEALWTEAPDERALAFCEDYARWLRDLQYREGETAFDAAGAYGALSLFPPRVSAAAGRTEGILSVLSVLERTGASEARIAPVRAQVERSLGLILRHQFRPGPMYLFASPERVLGGIPTSEADLDVRIDAPQHAGMAMLRYIRVSESTSRGHTHASPHQ